MVRAKVASTEAPSRRSTRSAAKAEAASNPKSASTVTSRRKVKDDSGICVESATARNESSLVSKTPARAKLQTGRTQKSLKHLPPVASLNIPTKGVRFASDDEEDVPKKPVTALKPRARATPGRSAKKEVNYRSRRDSGDSLQSKDGENSDFEVLSDETADSDESQVDEESPLATPNRPKFRKPPQFSNILNQSSKSIASKSDKDLLSALEDLSIQEPIQHYSPRKNSSRRDSLSSVDLNLATVRFSPPPSKPVYSLSPPKENVPLQPPERSSTPPLSPSKSKLTSPRKLMNRIPPTPGHRQSTDGFWNFNEVTDWNEQHSPRKTLKLQSPKKFQIPMGSATPRASSESSSEPPSPVISPTKRHIPESPSKRALAAVKKAFDARKISLANEFLAELDSQITSNRIAELTESSGGVKLIWSNKLNTTAGRANWRREAVHTHTRDPQTGATTGRTTTHRHVASIELASKVIDDEARLLNVLAHEFCHLANFMVSNVRTEPHGKSFQVWARKVSTAFAQRGVTVTTKHDYQIAYKFAWQCVECACEYQRHSRSIDTTRQRCGRCKSALVQIRPTPRKSGDAAATTAKKSAYADFVQENFKVVQKELGGGSPMKDVMREVGARYRAQKAAASSPDKAAIATAQTKKGGEVEVDIKEGDVLSAEEEEDEETESEDTGVLDVARKLDFLSFKAVSSSS